MFSHLNAWKHGVKHDKDSRVHPLVHLAWRALAIAWQETEAELRPHVDHIESTSADPPPGGEKWREWIGKLVNPAGALASQPSSRKGW